MVGTFRYVSSAAFYCSAFAFKASLAGTLSVVRADQRLLLAIGSGALACHDQAWQRSRGLGSPELVPPFQPQSHS